MSRRVPSLLQPCEGFGRGRLRSAGRRLGEAGKIGQLRSQLSYMCVITGERVSEMARSPLHLTFGGIVQYVLLADGSELLFTKALALPDGRLCAVTAQNQEWFAAGSWIGYSDSQMIVAMARKRSGGFTFERASETEAKPLIWLWQDRLLLGFINVILGFEKVGKGTWVAWLAAQVTHGRLEGALKGKPRNVIIFGHEDSWERVWVPRLKLAGADRQRVIKVHEVDNEPFDVRRHANKLAAFARRQQAGLVYFDQFLDTVGVGTNENRVKQIRDALNPLAKAAQRTECAFLGTLHPNKKNTGSYRDLISGTPAWNQLSRSGLLMTRHPNVPERRAIVVAASNYSKGAASFEFEIASGVFRNKHREVIEAGYVDEESIVEGSLTEADLIAASGRRGAGGGVILTKAAQGRKYLDTRLNGQRVKSAELKKELEELFDIGDREAKRLMKEMNLKVEYEGYPAESYWSKGQSD